MTARELHWRKSETHGLLPDPEPRPIRHTLISVDDHLVEPPGMFDGRLPARLQELAPRVVETVEGHEVWEFDGQIFFQVGLNAVVGRDRRDWLVEPTRFDEMRPGCFDVDARVRDMDINGVWASVNFPSQITGFCGSVFSRCSDPELGLAVTRGVERLVLRGVAPGAPGADRADGHHVPRRRRARGGGDPTQRRARLPRRHAARAAAPHRDAVGLLRLVGSRSSPRARRPTRSSASTWAAPASPTCRRTRRWCRSGRRCSVSSRSRRARSGCGPGTRSATRI